MTPSGIFGNVGTYERHIEYVFVEEAKTMNRYRVIFFDMSNQERTYRIFEALTAADAWTQYEVYRQGPGGQFYNTRHEQKFEPICGPAQEILPDEPGVHSQVSVSQSACGCSGTRTRRSESIVELAAHKRLDKLEDRCMALERSLSSTSRELANLKAVTMHDL